MTEDQAISTKDKPGVYDAIETAKPDEPLFAIQGGDPIGPKTVLFWASEARKMARKLENPVEGRKLLLKALSAEEVAWGMEEYQRNRPADVDGRRFSNYDETLAEQLTSEQADRVNTRQSLIAAAGALHNAIATVNDQAIRLAQLQVHPESEVKLREALVLLREAAFDVEPRRGSERT